MAAMVALSHRLLLLQFGAVNRQMEHKGHQASQRATKEFSCPSCPLCPFVTLCSIRDYSEYRWGSSPQGPRENLQAPMHEGAEVGRACVNGDPNYLLRLPSR